MKLTKRRIVLAAVLGVAVTALAWDRLVLGGAGPRQAAASMIPQSGPELPPLASAPVEVTQASVGADCPLATLAGRLSGLAQARRLDATTARDAFCPAAAWLGVEAKALAPVTSDEARAREFADRNRLTATVLGSSGRTAIINGQCLTVGRKVEGFELISVNRDSAVMACGRAKVTLRLAKDAAKTGEGE